MAPYYISSEGRVMEYHDRGTFLAELEVLLRWGKRFLVTIAKHASDACVQVNDIFKRHGIEVSIKIDSDPGAMDYVANALLGGTVGAAGGAIAGGAAWWIAKSALTYSIPGAGQFLLVGSVIGITIGAIAGLAVTRWGLTIRFSPLNSDNIDIELIPAS